MRLGAELHKGTGDDLVEQIFHGEPCRIPRRPAGDGGFLQASLVFIGGKKGLEKSSAFGQVFGQDARPRGFGGKIRRRLENRPQGVEAAALDSLKFIYGRLEPFFYPRPKSFF